MADNASHPLPSPSAEQRRIAAAQFERANQVITTGNHDYGIQLLLTCCKLDPGNLIYRQALRQTEKVKYKNNLRGSRFAILTNVAAKLSIKAALRSENYLKVLDYGERVLTRNPWDVGAQMRMAEASRGLGLLDMAVWFLEQARQPNPNNRKVNRALARLYEQRGNFTQAIALWEMLRKADPSDVEAQHKAKDLAASDTIARGRYEEVLITTTQAEQETPLEQEAENEEPNEADEAEAVPVPGLGDRVEREAALFLERIKTNPTSPHAYLQLATLYRRSNLLEQARAVLQEGLAPTGNNFELSIELADLQIEPFRRNLNVAEDQLRAKPQDEELRKIRIRLLKEINTRELDLYRQKAERYPTEMTFRFELGLRLLRANRIDEAIRELQAARADPRHHWRALLYLGYCFKSRNNWRLAQRNFEEALQNLPLNEEVTRKELLFQLAQGAADSGDLAKAVEVAYELANLDFSYRDIGRLLDEWQERLQGSESRKQ
jgi:tetratricopeptide (TPR) repeat protein